MMPNGNVNVTVSKIVVSSILNVKNVKREIQPFFISFKIKIRHYDSIFYCLHMTVPGE